jgi:hypothetical protein
VEVKGLFYYFTSNYVGMSLQKKVGGRGLAEVKGLFLLLYIKFSAAMHRVHTARLA